MRAPSRADHAGLFLLAVLLHSPAGVVRVDAAPAPAPYQYALLSFVFSPPHRDLAWLTEAFPLSIADRLERLGFTVASRRERIEMAEVAGVSSPSPSTLASRIKLARALRAARAITGTLTFEPGEGTGSAAGQIRVQTVILDVPRGMIVHRRTLTGTINELFSMMDEIALEVAWQDSAPPGPEARKILKATPDPPLHSFETVMRAVTEKDPERQAAALESAATASRGHPMLARRLADALIEAGRMEEGLAKLQALDPSRQPDPWRLHLDRAEILLALGDVTGAAEAAEQSVAARNTASVHVLLARLALARGDRRRAEAEARLAAAIDPEHPALKALIRQIAGQPPDTPVPDEPGR